MDDFKESCCFLPLNQLPKKYWMTLRNGDVYNTQSTPLVREDIVAVERPSGAVLKGFSIYL